MNTPSTIAPTGAQYLDSLRDDRCVFFNGERVRDVTSHPALRNAARSVARLYDALHEPDLSPALTCQTDTGSFGRTHRCFRAARTREDLVGAQHAIAQWARLSYGWLGRSPDYKAAFTNTLGANPDFYGPFAPNARRWYRFAQEHVPFMNHSIVNPPVDRHLPPHQIRDVCVRIEKETDAGIVVSGAKVVATAAAFTQYNFIGQTPATVGDDPSMAVAFMVPIAAPGLKLICRTSYEHAAASASPFDYPLSSRFDENDAILVLDRVFVPWEDVLIHRDPQRSRAFITDSGFQSGFLFHGCTRFAVKLEFIAGLLSRALHATGGDESRQNQALLGELIGWGHTFRSLSDAMALSPDPWTPGFVLPARQAALSYNLLAPQCSERVRDIVMQTVGSGFMYLPASVRDLHDGEIDACLSRFVRGSHGTDHVERIKVLKLLWDAIGSEFASRHALYERLYAGGPEQVRLQTLHLAQRDRHLAQAEALAGQCLNDYDTRGWRDHTWCFGPDQSPLPSFPTAISA